MGIVSGKAQACRRSWGMRPQHAFWTGGWERSFAGPVLYWGEPWWGDVVGYDRLQEPNLWVFKCRGPGGASNRKFVTGGCAHRAEKGASGSPRGALGSCSGIPGELLGGPWAVVSGEVSAKRISGPRWGNAPKRGWLGRAFTGPVLHWGEPWWDGATFEYQRLQELNLRVLRVEGLEGANN